MVLGNTDRPVERIGIELLGAPAPDMPADGRTGVLATVVALLLTAVTLPSLAAPAGRHTWWRPSLDRVRISSGALTSAVILLGVLRIGTWLAVPPILWAVAVGLAVGGAVGCALRWRGLPTVDHGPAWSRWTAFGVSVAIGGPLLVTMLLP